ncbi:MAG: flagellar motor switch protein FliM [Acidobacteriota bacterium]
MSRILSQEEIDALLHSATDGSRAFPDAASKSNVTRYNFRRPDRVSKEQMHSLQFLHERFARNVATSLSAYLRTITELSVVSVEQFSYSEFLTALADPTAFYALAIPPSDELGALEINPAIAFAMVDRMLGGAGQSQTLSRAMTEIEQNVIDSVVKIMLESLGETWRPIAKLSFNVRGRETRPQMLQVAAPNDIVVMVVFDMRIGEARGMMNLCMPASIVEASGAQVAQASNRHRREPSETERTWLRENLSRVPMGVTALIESRLSTRDLLALAPGDVVSLGVPAHQAIDLQVEGTLKFQGRLTVESGRLGVRVENTCQSNVRRAS